MGRRRIGSFHAADDKNLAGIYSHRRGGSDKPPTIPITGCGLHGFRFTLPITGNGIFTWRQLAAAWLANLGAVRMASNSVIFRPISGLVKNSEVVWKARRISLNAPYRWTRQT